MALVAWLRPRLVWRMIWLGTVPHLVMASILYAVPTGPLIFTLNSILVSMALMVCTAFSPAFVRVFIEDRDLDRSDYIAVGIWLGWFSIILRTGFSIVWRWFGAQADMVNARFLAYSLFTGCIAAACHVLAPDVLRDRVPTKQWIMLGVVAGLGLMLFIAIGYVLDAVNIINLRSD